MSFVSRTARRLIVAFVCSALVSCVLFAALARFAIDYAMSYRFGLVYSEDVVHEVEGSLGVYADLARSMKSELRAKADAIAAHEPLRAAAILKHRPSVEQELAAVIKLYPDLVSVRVDAPTQGAPGGDEGSTELLAETDRGKPVDEATERKLSVTRPLGDREGAATMTVVFAAPRQRLDEIERVSQWLDAYKAAASRVGSRGQEVREKIQVFFYLVLLLPVPIAIGIALLLAQPFTRRINTLTDATRKVAAGDLAVRVPEQGSDDLTDLARAFNRMLDEVEGSRARIEFLQRMGTWQEMARRLAHEIKNPLTPISLAVQECHRRYQGDSAQYRKLLDTTLEIVEEEVATLRRLVGEFSDFARLPRAMLVEGDLAAYLREQRSRLDVGGRDDDPSITGEALGALQGVSIEWQIADSEVKALLDAHMLHRVIVNLLANAAQAIRGKRSDGGTVRVTLSTREHEACIDIDDDGPGVPAEQRAQIFDPYFTTKTDGTGLGLAIVKKIVVEHGGTIEALESPLGGARLRLRLPLLGTAASDAARANSVEQTGPRSG